MQKIRFPFYVRTMVELEKVNSYREELSRKIAKVLTNHPYRLRQVDVTTGVSWPRSKRNAKVIPLKESNGKKWTGVLALSAYSYRAIDEPDIFGALEKLGVEPIRPQAAPASTFVAGSEVSVRIGTNDKMRLIASALDKKVGQGNWRMRGPNGYKKKLATLGKKRSTAHLSSVPPLGAAEKSTAVEIQILVSQDAALTQTELEKMVFTINLKT